MSVDEDIVCFEGWKVMLVMAWRDLEMRMSVDWGVGCFSGQKVKVVAAWRQYVNVHGPGYTFSRRLRGRGGGRMVPAS